MTLELSVWALRFSADMESGGDPGRDAIDAAAVADAADPASEEEEEEEYDDDDCARGPFSPFTTVVSALLLCPVISALLP